MASTRGRARVAALCVALALAAVAVAPGPASASPSSEIRQAFSRLITDTKRLPARDARVRRALLRIATRARRASRRSPCRARSLMRSYERRLRRLKRRPPPRGIRVSARRRRAVSTRGTLEADALAVDAALLSHPRARRCGGARREPSKEVETQLLASDERGLTVRVTLPQARFAPRHLGRRDWAEMVMDGLGTGGSNGQPGVPMLLEQFGVPTGADVSVSVSNVSSYTLRGVNLLPHQPEPVDGDQRPPGYAPEQTFFDKPFQIDRSAYRSRAPLPASPARQGPGGEMRDVRVGGAEVVGGQYRPRRKTLRVITGMDVHIAFGGDNKRTFGDARLTDPFNATFHRLYRSTLLNADVVLRHPGATIYPFCGQEVLIVTSPALRPAADTLRNQKVAEGFVTSIVETGTGPGQIGTTSTAIQSYIRGEINGSCWLRPSYVILIGNTDQVPTFTVPCGPGGDAAACNIASDLPYSLKDSADYFADTALGRIPAPDLATANTVVSKIVGYETTSPAPPGDDFFSHFTNTAYFEPSHHCVLNAGESGTPNCDAAAGTVNGHWEVNPAVTQDARGFSKTAERVRDAMRARGYTVDRLYNADPVTNPQTYYDGTPMPSAIRKPGFAWDADTTDFTNAFNDGRAIVFHRDHGWPGGWAHPWLHEGDLGSLTNGTQLPVAFGINCASAAFDNPGDPSFTEGLLQDPDGGAVGVFGDSRNSGTWANNHIAIGFFDALFPNLVGSFGGPDPLRRMGDVLVAGKQYLATADAGATYGHGHLYGYFGDPTMQLWIAPPVVFDPGKIKAEVMFTKPPIPKPPGPGPDPPPWWVNVTLEQPGVEGTLVTLEQKGVTVGRGVVRNGQATIFPTRDLRSPTGMTIALQNEGFFAGRDAVDDNF